MLAGAEQADRAVLDAIGLEPVEYRLGVVQNRTGRIEREALIVPKDRSSSEGRVFGAAVRVTGMANFGLAWCVTWFIPWVIKLRCHHKELDAEESPPLFQFQPSRQRPHGPALQGDRGDDDDEHTRKHALAVTDIGEDGDDRQIDGNGAA